MTIRYTLLRSYLLISLASALLIAAMIFVHFREIMEVEIENKLKSQAVTVMQQIDTALFERMENLVLWKQLDVMQELQFRDVDKRISTFLSRLHTGYDGVYEQLYVVDQNNQVISASDSRLIGNYQPVVNPWLTVGYKDNIISLLPLQTSKDRLYFSIGIPSMFQVGQLGQLYAGFDWQEVVNLLETSTPFSAMWKPAYAVLIDSEGLIIAKSSGFKSKDVDFYNASKKWIFNSDTAGVFETNDENLTDQNSLIAYATSRGYRGFAGLGWHVLIIQPTKIAFAPIGSLWKVVAVFLLLTFMLATLVSIGMAEKIARPIVKLAEFTRNFKEGKQQKPPEFKASREITALRFQFAEMIDNLEKSRLDTIRVAKLAVIGEMAASMAHEVRTPLGILKSSAQMLQREANLSTIGQEMTHYIISETQRLNSLVSTLLECSQPRPPKFIQHDFHEIIDYTLELVASQLSQKHIVLITDMGATRSIIPCDRDQMIQVLLNLLMNAIQHTPDGGSIEVRTLTDIKETFEVTICDSGKGISDADKKTVFDPFFTTRKDGIGLGLTVVQQIINTHSGKIFITDSAQGGACFHLTLPARNTKEK